MAVSTSHLIDTLRRVSTLLMEGEVFVALVVMLQMLWWVLRLLWMHGRGSVIPAHSIYSGHT
jgi:hypothetical protein